MTQSFSRHCTVALLDDHELIRHGLASRLVEEQDIEVIGSFGTSRQLFASLSVQTPDVIVVDYMLAPDEVDGLNLLRTLKIRYPKSRPLVLSAHYNPATVALAMQAGSRGFMGKSQEVGELVAAIRTVARGRIYLHPCMAEELAMLSEGGAGPDGDAATLDRHASLSPREREVLRCYLDGMSVNEIASKFSRSPNTISAQKQSAYRKLGIRTDNELFKIHHQLKV